MKQIRNSFLLAFSLYSISPKAKIERSQENSKYILVFIPLIGAVIGLILSQWAVGYPYLCNYQILPAVVGAVLPSMLSAGSHLDGFFRTVDALCSHQPIERRLEILEDSHGGYFAIIVCVWYFMLAIGVWSEMPVNGIFILAFGFVISRALYGFSILSSRHAKESKCSIYVPEGRLKTTEMIIMLGYVVVCGAGMIWMNSGVGFAILIGVGISYLISSYIARRYFGGVTEDTAGFFVQICEVLMPLAALIAYKQWW
ncbi:MAG: adenosylcobinamide-GDP ribazoletransferase [Lachnospiraceae bacterium]|nr:adenosylcobinamide-GDP ribazoletransferase [Lachnospiraceae bacterium]